MIEFGDAESFGQARGTCLYATICQKTLVVLVDASRKGRGCAASTIPVVSLIWLGRPARTECSDTGSRAAQLVYPDRMEQFRVSKGLYGRTSGFVFDKSPCLSIKWRRENSSLSRISIGKHKSRVTPGFVFKKSYIAALTSAIKESALRLAPPIRPPSISD
jgi:hypothetical protein